MKVVEGKWFLAYYSAIAFECVYVNHNLDFADRKLILSEKFILFCSSANTVLRNRQFILIIRVSLYFLFPARFPMYYNISTFSDYSFYFIYTFEQRRHDFFIKIRQVSTFRSQFS